MAGRYSFDVQTRLGGRWVIDCIREREDQARKRANELLADKACSGARIIRTCTRPDGSVADTEIFCQTREVKQGGPMRITPQDTLPGRCKTAADFFAFDSRQAMSRIFREYLSKALVTPTEIIYNFRHLRRIFDKDALVPAAVDLVASVQTRDGSQDHKARRDEIYQAVDQMLEQARGLEEAELPRLDGRLGAAMQALGGLGQEERNTLLLAALARDLGTMSNWVAKLDMLCRMAQGETNREALDLIDGVMADVLGTDVIQDLLGMQPTLGATICALLDLADGVPPAKPEADETTTSLRALLAARTLPASRRCIIERAHRALRLPSPLRPNDPAREPEELHKIICRVLTPTGLHSGADTAHALTTRFTRMVEQGGKTGRRAAISGVFHAMPDRAHGVIYLCDLARSELAHEHLEDMAALFEIVANTQTIGDFCHPELTANERMARATSAYHAVSVSPFASELRSSVAGHVDDLLARFVVEEKIIERLDEAGSPLRDRALRLVQFCNSGLLPKGKALKKAHERTLALLKQSDFPVRFVSGISDPAAAQAALRDFFALLKASGVYGA